MPCPIKCGWRLVNMARLDAVPGDMWVWTKEQTTVLRSMVNLGSVGLMQCDMWKRRKRQIKIMYEPSPSILGRSCVGDSSQTTSCLTRHCPGEFSYISFVQSVV
ncbi:hypothetical protein MAR_002766 [Mya arenaria]|uniref:Uncharacterized protein n=1 Tax=Mya arenaria TaxID=6604 RepID=A0ABY7G7M4_MYAAR|nr:hypothetical protein MAR_002766 [Mya arenaria]